MSITYFYIPEFHENEAGHLIFIFQTLLYVIHLEFGSRIAVNRFCCFN
jgi:hypothetical protein